jgi:hypothetical protein
MPILKWLLRSLLILAVFVPFAALLPLAALTLTRTPEGEQVLFWAGPWSAAFWVLVISQVVSSRCWRGAEAVRQWRATNGGFGRTIPRACGWMFGGLFLSYATELALIICFPGSPHFLLPVATYSPAAFALVWCSRG